MNNRGTTEGSTLAVFSRPY